MGLGRCVGLLVMSVKVKHFITTFECHSNEENEEKI
jgi:hypothetical protein